MVPSLSLLLHIEGDKEDELFCQLDLHRLDAETRLDLDAELGRVKEENYNANSSRIRILHTDAGEVEITVRERRTSQRHNQPSQCARAFHFAMVGGCRM